MLSCITFYNFLHTIFICVEFTSNVVPNLCGHNVSTRKRYPFSTIFLISMFCQYNLGPRQYNLLYGDIFRNRHTLFITVTMRNVVVNDQNLIKHAKLWIAISLDWRKISKNGFHSQPIQSVFYPYKCNPGHRSVQFGIKPYNCAVKPFMLACLQQVFIPRRR